MAAETLQFSSSYHEVFLSFRGPDTRWAVTDDLYQALDQAGIRAFKDVEDLTVEEDLNSMVEEDLISMVMNAIEQSRISVIIFSQNYATSTWCLRELAKIMECKKNNGQVVLPIFHQVDESQVRNQTGSFEEAFLYHEKRHPIETVDSWRKAMREAANLWVHENPELRGKSDRFRRWL